MKLSRKSVMAMATAGIAAMSSAPAQAADCDRECLISVANTYLGALVDHDPSQVSLASSIRMAENAVIIQPGDGFWKDASGGPSDFRIYVADPVSHQVGFIGMMTGAGNTPVQIGLRLKVNGNGKITEAEQIVVRKVREGALANLQEPRAGLLSDIPAAERMDRQAIIDDAAKYYDALDNNRGADAPFADDCVRRENGAQTTGNPLKDGAPPSAIPGSLGCSAQLDTNIMAHIGPVDRRDVSIADPVTGLAMSSLAGLTGESRVHGFADQVGE